MCNQCNDQQWNSCGPCNYPCQTNCHSPCDEILMFFVTVLGSLTELNTLIATEIRTISAMTYCALMRIKKLCIKKCYIKRMICQILSLTSQTIASMKAVVTVDQTDEQILAALKVIHDAHINALEMIYNCNYPKEEHSDDSSESCHKRKHKHKHCHDHCCEKPSQFDYDKWKVFRYIEVPELYLASCQCVLPPIFNPPV